MFIKFLKTEKNWPWKPLKLRTKFRHTSNYRPLCLNRKIMYSTTLDAWCAQHSGCCKAHPKGAAPRRKMDVRTLLMLFINLDTGSVDWRPGSGRSWTVENVFSLVTSCSIRKLPHRQISQYFKFHEILEFFGYQLVASPIVSGKLCALFGRQCVVVLSDIV